MAGRIVEGLWDCPYCGTKAIGGLTKHCPCCGHPQDAGTRFYMGTKIKYLDQDLAEQYGKGADWLCSYCGSLNRVRFKYCANCGSAKDESTADYFSNKPNVDAVPKPTPRKQNRPRWRRLLPLFVIAALIITMAAVLWPHKMTAEVITTSWTRQIEIEAYRTVQESAWDVPDGGRVYDQRRELHHYDQVVDHYETRTRTVSEQVYDGEDTHTSYSDNGDGTFSEHTYSSPRYRTEYHDETYSIPIYRDVPVYHTKYYYDIDKWTADRDAKSEGVDCEPYWPEYALTDNERTGFQYETYKLDMMQGDDLYVAALPYDIWRNYHVGDPIEITVSAGELKKVAGYSLD